MIEKDIMSEEAFNEIVEGFEFVEKLTPYGRKNLKYHIKRLQQENQELKNQQKEFIEYLETEKDRLEKECSHTYEDSLGKMMYVNEDIYNEVNKILSKYKEVIGNIYESEVEDNAE